MAVKLTLSSESVNAEADALSNLIDNGYLRIYDGAQPITANTAISTQTLLAELRFNTTASPAAASGVLTMNALSADSSANAASTASWFRALQSDGATVAFDGTVGATTDFDLTLNSLVISAGAQVSVSSMTYTVVKSS
jgi:hypothetical protein